ncbi:hypothetical protein [Paenibacillus campi]|nr:MULTISPECIES: hypothetical protein [unclassified Paenibacillus]
MLTLLTALIYLTIAVMNLYTQIKKRQNKKVSKRRKRSKTGN